MNDLLGHPGWDPTRISASPSAVEALRSLGAAVQDSGFRNMHDEVHGPEGLALLAAGVEVEAEVAYVWLGGGANTDGLITAGGADRNKEGAVALRFAVLAGAGALAVLPKRYPETDRIYVGPDSWVLLKHAWRFGLGGDRAVELGTGTGLVATFLTTRYERVIATDVLPAAVATAALSRQLLGAAGRSRLAVSVNDVAAGLASRSFDFVVANAPWVPSRSAGGQIFADGGPTGFELPLRFLLGGTDLLSDRGVMVLLCADLRFSDGRAPLMETLEALGSQGFAYEVEVTPRDTALSFEVPGVPEYMEGIESAAHVGVVVYRR